MHLPSDVFFCDFFFHSEILYQTVPFNVARLLFSYQYHAQKLQCEISEGRLHILYDFHHSTRTLVLGALSHHVEIQPVPEAAALWRAKTYGGAPVSSS